MIQDFLIKILGRELFQLILIVLLFVGFFWGAFALMKWVIG